VETSKATKSRYLVNQSVVFYTLVTLKMDTLNNNANKWYILMIYVRTITVARNE
jgi:hypothetical protein